MCCLPVPIPNPLWECSRLQDYGGESRAENKGGKSHWLLFWSRSGEVEKNVSCENSFLLTHNPSQENLQALLSLCSCPALPPATENPSPERTSLISDTGDKWAAMGMTSSNTPGPDSGDSLLWLWRATRSVCLGMCSHSAAPQSSMRSGESRFEIHEAFHLGKRLHIIKYIQVVAGTRIFTDV